MILRRVSNSFSLIQYISLDEFSLDLLNNKLKITVSVYMSDLVSSNMTIDITLNFNNFLEEFNKLFSNSIKYDYLYGDGITYSWVKYDKDKFSFTNPNNCNINRMGLEQKLSIKEISDDKLIYIIKI